MSNRNVPELRLDGFEGEWERQNVASISKPVTRVTPSSTAPVMMISAASGFIPQSNKYSSDNAGKSLSKYIELYQDELAYNHGASKLRQFGSCFKLNVPAARVPFVYHCFQVPENDPTFVGFSLNRDSVQEQLRRLVSSGARMDGLLNISFEQYGTVEISLPTAREQQAIGAVFTSLDAAIDQHTDKHRVLQYTKTALMQKMFPQDGQTEPELRLDGFSGEWLADPIKRIAPLQRGFDLPHAQIRGGSVPVVMSNGVQYRHDTAQAKGPGVVTGRSGTIGKVQYISEDYWPHNTTLWVTDFHRNDPKFICYLFETIDLKRLASGSGVPTLNRNDVHDHVSAVPPTFEEQQAIGAVFTKLDALISAEAQLIEKFKQTKTALLQKMFV